jgi:predicted permease
LSLLSALDVLGKELRYAGRQLRQTPGFAAVAVLTLALGIGANTAVFSVMDAVLLRALPVRNPQELVYLHTSDFPGGQTGYGSTSMRMQVYEALRLEKRAFAELMAWVPLGIGKVPVRYGTQPEEAQADMVSGNFFPGLGVPAAAGRNITLDDEANHSSIAVLSYAYWTRRFNRNPSIIGKPFYIKGVPFTIVGVAGRNFTGLDRGKSTDVWVPFQVGNDIKPWGGSAADKDHQLYGSKWWFLLTIGRLAPGISRQQAASYLNPIFQRASVEGLSSADTNGRKPATLTLSDTRGMEGMREEYEQPLHVLLGMVGLVLVIACGNVAMLMMARNAARQREFSLRMALGGSRARLFRQLLTESLLLVIVGSALGWLLALWATGQLAKLSLLERSLAPNVTVLLFTLAVSAAAALIFGLAPLRAATGAPMGLMMKVSTASHQDRSQHRSGQVVVALQISLCLVLLIGGGLLVRTLRNLENLDLGLRASGLLVFGVSPQQHVHSDAEAINFYQALLERMRTLPGVESTTLVRQRLGAGWSSNTTPYIDGQRPILPEQSISMRWNGVGPGFLHVFAIPLRLGRDFTDADSAAAPKVVIVNETFAHRYLPNTTAVGHQVAFSNRTPDSPQYTIVGVAADSKYTEVRETVRPMAYFPYNQITPIDSTMQVMLRSAGNPLALLPEARRAMNQFAPDLPLLQPTTQQEQFDESLSSDRLFARLASFFGLLAVLLVATGLYATLAFKVARRTAEIGIRMALGAQRRQVLWLVLRESLVLCLVGVVMGLPVAIAGARLLRSMLFGLEPFDPLTFIAALAGVVSVALAAGAVPARKASSVVPIVALRCE